jgi:hypothetical protein
VLTVKFLFHRICQGQDNLKDATGEWSPCTIHLYCCKIFAGE